MEKILLGFEVGTGKEVYLPPGHTNVTGMTQLSGKTTCLEALVQRGDVTAIAFLTKRGEKGFTRQRTIQPYFREQKKGDLIDWQYVSAILEATMGERMKFERSWIINSCKGTHNLEEVYENIRIAQSDARRALDQSVYTNLAAYFEIILPQIKKYKFAEAMELQRGFNVLNLIGMREEMQQLIIESVLSYVLTKLEHVIVVLPEAHKFIPQGRNTPVKGTAVRFIQEGAVLGNYLWIDSMPGYEAILCRINGRVHALTFESLFLLPADSRMTERGEIIKVPFHNIDVPSSDGHGIVWRPLKYIIAHDYSGDILQINTVGGLVDVSPNHPVMKYPRYLVEADKLQIGDRLCSREFKENQFKNGGPKGRFLFIGTHELAWLYGFYAAEGWPEGIANADKEKIDKVFEILRRYFYIDPTITEQKGVYTLWFGSPLVTSHFKKFMYLPGIEMHDSSTKWVPPEILNAHAEVQQAFIEGYEAGNGHFNEDRNYVRSVTSNSRALLLGINYMKRSPFSVHIRDDKPAIQLIFNKTSERRKPRDEIKKTRRVPYQGKLYDLEVGPDDHTFYIGIGNIRVHNTQVTTTVDKDLLKQCSNWIMGFQQERNEVQSVRENLGKHKVEEKDIMSLKLGHFMASLQQDLYHVYVLPADIEPEVGRAVALGKIRVEEVRDSLRMKEEGVITPMPTLESEADRFREKGLEDLEISDPEELGKLRVQVSEISRKVIELEEREAVLNQESWALKETVDSMKINYEEDLKAHQETINALEAEKNQLMGTVERQGAELSQFKAFKILLSQMLDPFLVSDEELEEIRKDLEKLKHERPRRGRTLMPEVGETGIAWIDVWLSKLGPAEQRILRFMAAKYPLKMTKSEIALGIGLTARGGYFSGAFNKLRKNKLIVETGDGNWKLAEVPPG